MSAVDLIIAASVALLAGGINSVAGGGSLILFKSPRMVLENRPTQLHITAPDGSKAHVNLDI